MGDSNNYGLNNTYEYFEFSFDSLDTNTSPDASVSTLDWPLFMLQRPLTEVAAIKIIEVEIPFTYYVFNEFNNTFTLQIGAGPLLTVTIPIGNYSSTSMANVLGTILTTAALPSPTFTVTYSGASSTQPNTGKFTISTAPPTQFTLTFGSNQSTSPHLWLGFNPGSITSNLAGVLVAPNVAAVTGPNYLYLNSRKIGQMCNMYLPEGAENLGGGVNSPQMAKIPVNVQPNGIIFWQDPDPQKWFDIDGLNHVADLDFYFTLGNMSTPLPLEFNGQSFSLKLGVLVRRPQQTEALSGLTNQNRVVKRIKMK